MELLIALEMSRLQMIEDEARRRQSLLQEHSRGQHWDAVGAVASDCNYYYKGNKI